jgi:diguanylate cyclase (GGDEF)-like protein
VLLGDVDTGFEVTHAAGPLEHGLAEMEARDVDHLARVLAPMTSVYSSGEITGLASVGGATLRDAGAQALIAVPLVARARRIGILVLANSHPLPIGPSVAESLEVLASVAGSCLETSGDMAELRTRANRDALTGLRNHARFHEELRERSAGRACIALFDIDRFKDVNDTLGHLAGDQVLRETAAALKSAAAPGAMLFRIGGDELAALLPTNDADLAATMATQMIVAARSVLHRFGADLSAGIAVRRDGEDLMDTLHRADAALYRAKASGGGAVSRG